VLNLANDEAGFWTSQGSVADTRLNLLMVAPPGYMKTLLMSFYLGKDAICPRGVFRNIMTEAGLIGSVDKNGVTEGLASRESRSIIGIDEYRGLHAMMRTEHSGSLDTALLSLLDSGWVYKTLKAGEIEYRSRSTLWFGLQPCFIDMRQGHMRRLFATVFIPSIEEQEAIKQARRRGRDIGPDPGKVSRIRKNIEERAGAFKEIKEVSIGDEFYSLMDRLGVPHTDEILYERLVLGYSAMKPFKPPFLDCSLCGELRAMVINSARWRYGDLADAEAMMVASALSGGEMSKTELYRELARRFGVSGRHAGDVVERLKRDDAVRVRREKRNRVWVHLVGMSPSWVNRIEGKGAGEL
jgi:hypothetical protein